MFEDRYVSVVQTDESSWTLTTPVHYGQWLVPAGYVTDFASVPRLVWALVPRFGAYTAATVLHDWLITDALPAARITSRAVDRLFREAMRELGVSFPRRWLMWAGVRWGAVANSSRRGWPWLRDLPAVLLISVLALPLLLPALVVLPSLLIFLLLDLLGRRELPEPADGIDPGETPGPQPQTMA